MNWSALKTRLLGKVDIGREQRKELAKLYGGDLSTAIDVNDEMYQFLSNHPKIVNPIAEYFASGNSMLSSLKDILSQTNYDINSNAAFLDFASGYGRLTRYLVREIEPARITVSDIDANAVRFCTETFKVQGFNSFESPDELVVSRRYDVIWVASLFSHLPIKIWGAWLKKLITMLNDDGIIIFSTHGLECMNGLPDEIKTSETRKADGFYFFSFSETKRLGEEIYGSAYVSEPFVRGYVSNNNLGDVIFFKHKGLWNYQDVYVIRRRTSCVAG